MEARQIIRGKGGGGNGGDGGGEEVDGWVSWAWEENSIHIHRRGAGEGGRGEGGATSAMTHVRGLQLLP